MPKNFSLTLIPHTAFILLAMHFLDLTKGASTLFYTIIVVVMYAVSLLYFNLVNYIIKRNKKKSRKSNKKFKYKSKSIQKIERKLLFTLAGVYLVIGCIGCALAFFKNGQSFNELNLDYVAIAVVLVIFGSFGLGRITLYLLERINDSK